MIRAVNAVPDIDTRQSKGEAGPLAQAVAYIATAPKSNASAQAIWKASEDVKSGRTLPVPDHLRDASYRSAKKLGHGTDYKYSHDYPGGYSGQSYLPEDRKYST